MPIFRGRKIHIYSLDDIKAPIEKYGGVTIGDLSDITFDGGFSIRLDLDLLKLADPSDGSKSDFFIVPFRAKFRELEREQQEFEKILANVYRSLPHWNDGSNHVVITFGVPFKPFSIDRALIYTVNSSKGDHTFPIHYLIDGFSHKDITDCKYRCAFQGCLNTHPLRLAVPKALGKIDNSYFKATSDFFYFLPESQQLELSFSWNNLLGDSQYILCPRGWCVNSFRFFETMAAGRIPVLISDQAKLPLDHVIDYSKFVVRVPEKDILSCYKYIDSFEKTYNLSNAAKISKETWLKFFTKEKLGDFFAHSLPRKMFL